MPVCEFNGCVYRLIIAGNKVYMSYCKSFGLLKSHSCRYTGMHTNTHIHT